MTEQETDTSRNDLCAKHCAEQPLCQVAQIEAIGGEFRSYQGLVQPFAMHAHAFYVIGRVKAGERILKLNDTCARIMPGSLIVLNPGDTHGCTQESAESFTYESFTIPAALLDGAKLRFPAKDEADIQSAYDDAVQAIQTASDEAILECVLLLASLLEIGHSVVQHTIHEESALRVYAHLCGHLAKAAHISELAAMEGLSEYALIRAYRKRFHITPLQHLLSLRVECACKLLGEGASVAAVAAETGFSDQAHLTRVFKQRMGITPAAYQGMVIGNEQRT